MKPGNLICFALGIAVGAVATYYITKESFEKQAQEDINAMRKEYEKEIEGEESDELTEEVELSQKKQEEDLFREYDPYATEYHKVKDRDKPKAVIFEPPTDEKNEEGNDVPEAEKESPREEVAELPYMITADDFSNTRRYYDKVTVSYYDDGALMNEEDQPVELDLIGTINLTLFRTGKTDDPEWMYIRNERICTDFEVERIHGNYTDGPVTESPDGS